MIICNPRLRKLSLLQPCKWVSWDLDSELGDSVSHQVLLITLESIHCRHLGPSCHQLSPGPLIDRAWLLCTHQCFLSARFLLQRHWNQGLGPYLKYPAWNPQCLTSFLAHSRCSELLWMNKWMIRFAFWKNFLVNVVCSSIRSSIPHLSLRHLSSPHSSIHPSSISLFI